MKDQPYKLDQLKKKTQGNNLDSGSQRG